MSQLVRLTNDFTQSDNILVRAAGYALNNLLTDPDNAERIAEDSEKLAALAHHLTQEKLMQACAYQEVPPDAQRMAFVDAAKNVITVMMDTWHLNMPLKPGEQLTMPVRMDCGFEGYIILQLKHEGACKIEVPHGE